jgi:hypothetical protein
MHASKIVLALALVLVVAHAAEPQAAQPQRAAPTPFGTLNGLYQKWSGSPLAIHGFSGCPLAVLLLLLLLLQLLAFMSCSYAVAQQPVPEAVVCNMPTAVRSLLLLLQEPSRQPRAARACSSLVRS